MNFRNKYAVLILRSLFGLFMAFSGVSGLYAASHGLQGIPEPMLPATQALLGMGLFHMIKLTELVAGLMLLTGFLPALAAIFLAPLAIGIIIFNTHVAPELVISGVIVAVFDAYMGYVYWDKYKALFEMKAKK